MADREAHGDRSRPFRTATRVVAGLLAVPLLLWGRAFYGGIALAFPAGLLLGGLHACAFVLGVLLAGYAMLGGRPRWRRGILGAMIGAFVLGIPSLLAGVGYAHWLQPDNPKGAAFGVLIAGPAGFVLGAAAGATLSLGKRDGSRG